MLAVVLGGTSPHIELIKELHSRDYNVILVDYLNNPPARKYADFHIQESSLDKEKVLKIVRDYNADIVISACIDQANSVCCYVAEQLSLPRPYSYKTSLLVTLKTEMKKVMVENDIPTSWFQTVGSDCIVNWDRINFPAVVKPADCNSSKGVRKVFSIEESKACLVDALSYSRCKQALIEGFVEGSEIQVDCFATDNSAKVVLTRQKKQLHRDSGEEMNSEGSIIPAPVCQGMEAQLEEIAVRIARGFKLYNTPFFYQAIVDRKDVVNVLEFAPRVGGGLSYYILKNLAGFDAIRAVVNSYLGINGATALHELKHKYSTNLLYMKRGIFDHIEGLDLAKNQELIKEYFITKEKGTSIGSELRSGNRVGAFIVEADSFAELKQKEDQVYSLIDIIDVDGKSQMRRREN